VPELPEVRAVVEQLQDRHLAGRRIAAVTVGWSRTVGSDPEGFSETLVGRTISGFHQHGKYIFMDLRPPGVVSVHLRMSGKLYTCETGTVLTGYERVIIHLDGARDIRFDDPRKFGRVLFHHDRNEVISRLGVVPLSDAFTADRLERILAVRRRRLKPLLLDQAIISGLGNIYTDEALWRAGIHPLRMAATLTRKEIESLHTAIQEVLLEGISRGGTRLGNGKGNFSVSHSGPLPTNQFFLKVFGQTGKPCPRCGVPIERITVAQRGTHICPECQTCSPPRCQ
jgi:formamidopyrimidine-DNA glycosylase